MPRYIDKKDAESGGMPAPGRYYAEVDKAEEKQSKAGDAMFNVHFKDVESGSGLCYDNIMLGGRGVGIGVKKLKCLGAAVEEDGKYALPDDANELVGLRCYLTLKHEKYTDGNGNAKTRCVVDFDHGDAFGYEAEPEKAGGTDEIPF